MPSVLYFPFIVAHARIARKAFCENECNFVPFAESFAQFCTEKGSRARAAPCRYRQQCGCRLFLSSKSFEEGCRGKLSKKFPPTRILCKKRRGFHRAVFPFKSGLLGSANRASACACTAVDANVSVNYVLVALLADSANGALSSTCTASDALVGNLVCHGSIPPYRFVALSL
jgi:hypothetical protein